MLEHTLSVLEYDKILARLAEHARTEGGRQLCLQLRPFTTLAPAAQGMRQTTDALSELVRLGGSPITAIADLSECLSRAQRGGVLSPRELLDVAAQLNTARLVRNSLTPDMPENHPQRQNLLRRLAMTITPQRTLEEDIRRAIISDEEIADSASPELAAIRRKKRRVQDAIREKLDSYLRSPGMLPHLQEVLVTQRSGRFVLPVKAGSRGAVPGIVHDQSATGATVFIEPMAVVEMNNQLRQLAGEERDEIDRILAEFTARVAMYGQTIAQNQAVLYELDFAFAKGELSRRQKAVEPELNDQSALHFVRARHPLIPEERVVPVDVWLGEAFSTLVITGPNTGGKTVALKTVGLLSLMAASGLHIPCQAGSRAAVFCAVFADIGDEQSIEQSLSTFSSHIKHIVTLLQQVQPGSLVMLDELGAGTDPAEGAALAISVLTHLHNAGARTVATTHYSEVKAFALTAQGIENASMEFDVQSLQPTYRMSIGIPGQSNAFAIASRLGMPQTVIDRAHSLLTDEEIHFEQVISSAQEQRLLAEKEYDVARRIHDEAVSMRQQAAAQQKKLAEREAEVLSQARAQARRLLLQAREQADRVAAIAQKAKNAASNESLGELKNQQKQLRESLMELGDEGPAANEQPLEQVTVGQRVRLAGSTTLGEVTALPDAKGNVQIMVGAIRMSLPLSRLCQPGAVPAKAAGFKKTRTVRPSQQPKTAQPGQQATMSLDLRGKTIDEALPLVDGFLDRALLAGLQEVSIIHGKGTGALRAGIQAHLKGIRQIKGFRIGNFGEGDHGVTVVQL